MLTLEYKLYGKKEQKDSIDNAIRVAQFIRNKCIRLWMDEHDKPKEERIIIGRWEMCRYSAVLAKEFPFVSKLNSAARQASAERAWESVSRFYQNCKKKVPGKKGFPQYKKDSRSVEYKHQAWKISDDYRYVTFNDKNGIGTLRIRGGESIKDYSKSKIKRVRIIRKADGYYCHFLVEGRPTSNIPKTGKSIGLDVGIESFYTDSNGIRVENPRFLIHSEKKIKRLHRRLDRKKKNGRNRNKYIKKLGRKYLRVRMQRKDFVMKLARCVMISNDIVAIEDLKIKNMVRNTRLSKHINDAAWGMFRTWLEYYSKKFDRKLITVNPKYTSQVCSDCGTLPEVKKKLSDRWHNCDCGCSLHRDHNAAKNCLHLATTGSTPESNVCGDANLYNKKGNFDVASYVDEAETQNVS